MTKSQSKALGRIKDALARLYPRHEIKHWSVTSAGRSLSVVAETGLPDDEGTCASLFCRNRLHVFVGPRGGLSAFNGRWVRGWRALYAGLE
jgi:hypothetical protein